MKGHKFYLLYLLFVFFTFFPSHPHVHASPEDIREPEQMPLTELAIEELMEVNVSTASRYEQKSREAPASVTVITASEIKKYGYRTLADILQSVRGIFTTSDRNYRFIGIRGFGRPGDYNSRILLLVDGQRINDNIYDQAPIGTDFPIDVDIIDRVEIVRGPTSSLYGTNAFFGVINVITKNGRDFKGGELSGEAGSLKTYKTRLTYGLKDGMEGMLSGSYYDSKGNDRLYYPEFDTPETNNGFAENLDYNRYKSLLGEFAFNDFTLQGTYIKRKKGVPTASFGTVFNDSRFFTVDEYLYADLKYEKGLANDLSIMARLSYNAHNYYGDYPYDYAAAGDPPDIVINKDLGKGVWWGGELQITKRLFERHKIVAGGEFRYNSRQDQLNYDRAVYLDDRRHSKNWALYIQDEFEITKNLLLNAGLRRDYYYTFGETTNPRLSLIYYPFENTTLKFLYGSAFRAPNAYELYYNDLAGPNTTKPNPDLKPETIRTYELILEQGIGNHLRGSVGGYYYKIDDLLTQQMDADGLLVYRNADSVDAKGMEFELEGKLPAGLEGQISYAVQNARDSKTRIGLTNSPEHLAKLNLTLPLMAEKVFIGIEEQYTGKRKTIAGNYLDNFFITNVTLFSRKLLKNSELSASVYNLFDEKYRDPASQEHLQDAIEQDGRIFRFKLTYAF